MIVLLNVKGEGVTVFEFFSEILCTKIPLLVSEAIEIFFRTLGVVIKSSIANAHQRVFLRYRSEMRVIHTERMKEFMTLTF